MPRRRRLISFDWAMKKLLRSKANFDILEGFLSELLKDDITILEILESESNQENAKDKFNRVDLKVKNQHGEIVIIEVQYEMEMDYLQRILYGTSRVITEHIDKKNPYSQIVKVISVNILYFDLGIGSDYIYHGSTLFRGVHGNDILQLSPEQQKLYRGEGIQSVFPEYYLIKVNNFNDIAKTSLDEWIYFLKNEEIQDNFQAKGLKKAKQELDILKLPDKERLAYERYEDDMHYQASMVESTYVLGMERGMEKGMEKGMERGMEKGMEKGIQEGMEKGLEQGLKQGIEQGIQKGIQQGIQKGIQQGIEQGIQKGIQQGIEQGVEKGIEQGLKQGEKNKALDIARQLLDAFDTETIAAKTGLPAEEVDALKAEQRP